MEKFALDSELSFKNAILNRFCNSIRAEYIFFNYTPGRILKSVDQLSSLLSIHNVRAGEVVSLKFSNHIFPVVGLLALLFNGNVPLILSPELTEPEILSIQLEAKCAWRIEFLDTLLETKIHKFGSNTASRLEGGILMPTSGSTGFPKIIFRSEHSLLSEAYRYCKGVGLFHKDRIVLPLPISHAYALGWLTAALIAGAYVELMQTQELLAIEKAMSLDATIVVLTPTLARLLAKRKTTERALCSDKLRFVMVGGGGVDEALDQQFVKKFGIHLSRNYGSTETGATFFGIGDFPSFCIGSKFPDIDYRIKNEKDELCKMGEAGILELRGEGFFWYNTGDIAYFDEKDRVYIVGRKNKSIRVGDRWISPVEIERVLQEYEGIEDVHVYAEKNEFSDKIVSDIVPNALYSEQGFFEFCDKHLAPYKIPHKINRFNSLNRKESGKIKHSKKYFIGANDNILKFIQYYKVSELLFVLFETGIWNFLREGASAESISSQYGFQIDEVEYLLDLGERLGIFFGHAEAQVSGIDMDSFIDLESVLSKLFTNRDTIRFILENGRNKFSKNVTNELSLKYKKALHGKNSRLRVLKGLRFVSKFNFARVIEVSGGAPDYVLQLSKQKKIPTLYFFSVGDFSRAYSPELSELITSNRLSSKCTNERDFDLCIFNNAIHYFSMTDLSNFLSEKTKKDSIILVDDLFLPEKGFENVIGLDWLTHGGIHFKRVEELVSFFKFHGVKLLEIVESSGDALHKVFIFKNN